MCTREIINWKEAIDLTIERHQAVLNGKYKDYIKAKWEMMHPEWNEDCPLCEYVSQNNKKKFYVEQEIFCKDCIWIKETGDVCFNSDEFDYNDDKASIKRLKEWKKGL